MADDKTIAESEIARIEAEVKAKQSEALKSQVKEIEERVRKEFEEKAQMEKLQEQLKKQQEESEKLKKEMEEKLKLQEETFKKHLEESLAKSKGIVVNQSPFDSPAPPAAPSNIKILPDGSKVDLSRADEIEENSRREFMKLVGIQNEDWGRKASFR